MFKHKKNTISLDMAVVLPVVEKTGLLVGQLPVDQICSQPFNIDMHGNIMNDVSAYFAATDDMQRNALALRLQRVLPENGDENKGKSIRQILDETPSARAQHFDELFMQAEYLREVAEKYNVKVETPKTVADVPKTESKTDEQILNEA